MIETVVQRWHEHLRGELPGGLDELLADDVVFHSPIVFTPQEGKALTSLYLQAAFQTLPGDGAPSMGGSDGPAAEADEEPHRPGEGSSRFRYTKQVMSGDTAVLEFETTVQGTWVNGVDIIRCEDAGRIVEFRVMLRPLKAINLVHDQMRAMIEQMSTGR